VISSDGWVDGYYNEGDFVDDIEPEGVICPCCNGSGEGKFDGSVCPICNGKGEV
jgi:rubrerythrin